MHNQKRQMTLDELLAAKEQDAEELPGFPVPYTPEEAELVGAIEDSALEGSRPLQGKS